MRPLYYYATCISKFNILSSSHTIHILITVSVIAVITIISCLLLVIGNLVFDSIIMNHHKANAQGATNMSSAQGGDSMSASNSAANYLRLGRNLNLHFSSQFSG